MLPLTLTALAAPPEFAARLVVQLAKNSSMLYVAGNHSEVLPRLSRQRLHFDVRRAFTAYQLLQVLSEVMHDIVFIEHDGFEASNHLIEAIFLAMREISRNGSRVVYYSAKPDSFYDFIARNSDSYVVVRRVGGGYVVWAGKEFYLQPTLGDLIWGGR